MYEDKTATGMYKRMVTIANHSIHIDIYANGTIAPEVTRALQREIDSVLDRLRIGQTDATVVPE